MINQMSVINIPQSPVRASVADEHWHSLCGSGAVDSVSIGDRVELDRLWLPSLLHVTLEKAADVETHELQRRRGAGRELRYHTGTGRSLDMDWHRGAVMSWRGPIVSLMGGWTWMIRRWTSQKYLHSSSGQHGCAWDSAPSAGDGWYYHAVTQIPLTYRSNSSYY